MKKPTLNQYVTVTKFCSESLYQVMEIFPHMKFGNAVTIKFIPGVNTHGEDTGETTWAYFDELRDGTKLVIKRCLETL